MSIMERNVMHSANVTRKQPKPYQFIEGHPAIEAAQENDLRPTSPKTTHGVCAKTSRSDDTKDLPTSSPRRLFPSTPATRLPLAELIGNTDEHILADAAPDASPREHISWHILPSPDTKRQSIKTPAPKKRARSSSPCSSSQKSKTVKESFDLQPLSQTLKTPFNDPATNLWLRYAGKVSRNGDPNNLFSELPASSSPLSVDDQMGTVSGLRRWTSCGFGFPSSKAKRRKTGYTPLHAQLEDVFADEPLAKALGAESIDHSKRIKIEALLTEIQENMQKTPHAGRTGDPKAPSSSSPLPDRVDEIMRSVPSPSKVPRHSPSPQHAQTKVQALNTPSDQNGCYLERRLPAKEPSSSSFGTDELDFADLAAVAEQTHLVTTVAAKDSLTCPRQRSPDTSHANHNPPTIDDDIFGLDEDLDTTDLDAIELLATQAVKNNVSLQSFGDVCSPARRSSASLDMDEFDDDFDDETLAMADAATTQSPGSAKKAAKPLPHEYGIIQRYLVQNVYEGQYMTTSGQSRQEKVLLVEDEKTKLNKAVTLRDSWFDTRCSKGAYIHIIGQFSKTGQCIVDDGQNMIILHPDHLISALVVADSFSCIRRAVLQDRIKATSDASPPQLYGTILHEIFQAAMEANRWDSVWLLQTVTNILSQHIEALYELKLSVNQAIEHLQSKFPALQAWAERFISLRPGSEAVVKDRNDTTAHMSVNKLLDVEEHVWSPMYGLKGNIDATIQVTMQDGDGERVLTVPFEVKTGKNSSNASHRAQTALYTLLLSDRYDIAIAYGILYYMETSEISRVPAIRHEIRHMIMQRNELACFVCERLSLPPMLKSTHTCGHCYAKTACFVYHKLAEDGDGESSGMREKFDKVVRHLDANHQEFFRKWDRLLTKEESEMAKFRRELWTMLGYEREKLGRCFANVVLEPGNGTNNAAGPKINRYQYTFRKLVSNGQFHFNEAQIAVGEPIVISDEKGHYALAKGYVTALTKYYVMVAVDRRLHNSRKRQAGFHPITNQTFSAIMDVAQAAGSTPEANEDVDPVQYRIDKDEFSNGMATVRNNLIQIMDDEQSQAKELRKLIVDGAEPRFKATPSGYALSGPPSQMDLNEDQRNAIAKIFTAQDYAVILGMPGTGKTTTIAHIIRALVARGKSVLLTSYTHNAVDNILLKIRNDNIGVLRLGALAKIHPEVQKFAVLASEAKGSIEELDRALNDPQVVATTCLGTNHQVFKQRVFDYCIVDEASQITLPVCLGPIRMARTFVLVGDHFQLPPLVQNREAQEGGLDVSLFKLLSEKHPSAVVTLRHQYRMNAEIMSLSNNLIYCGRLRCGSEAVAQKRLDLPSPDSICRPGADALSSQSCWVTRTLGCESAPVIFLNTDTITPRPIETAHGARIVNEVEAALTVRITHALLHAGVDPSSIGIITWYRSQLALIKAKLQQSAFEVDHSLSRPAIPRMENTEAHTTDRFQGRDKEIILLSCVRSNDAGNVGDLLKDWRRVNVALTRARSKLVIIGSKQTLSSGDALLVRLVDLCHGNGWIVDLPALGWDDDAQSWGGEKGVGFSSSAEMKKDMKEALDGRPSSQTAGAKSSQVKKIASSTGAETGRAPLTPQANSRVNRAFKAPTKVGKVTPAAMMGGKRNMKNNRPILADVINAVIGDGALD